MLVPAAIHELLSRFQAASRVVPDATSRLPVREQAKLVVCVADGTLIHVLLSSSLAVNLERLRNLTGATEIRLARDDEESDWRSTEPMFVDVKLAHSQEIVLVADTPVDPILIPWPAFARHLRPVVGDFAEAPRDRVGAYRLSYRE
jgi:hypothetical protein